MQTCVVTGCAGFIGSHLTDRLLDLGFRVTGVDHFSTGQHRFLQQAKAHPHFKLVEADLFDADLEIIFKGAQTVFHLAANADVRFGLQHPHKDIQQNTLVTFRVLEAMRAQGVKNIVFASTGAIYGEAKIIPTPEDAPFPVQTSLYGASKLACEGMIEAYSEGFGFKSWIFRFVSILGERYTHGHVFDFYSKLLDNHHELHILGDGAQRKSYLYVQDCVDAILFSMEHFQDKVNILNLGTKEYCQVNDSVSWITEYMGLKPKLHYSGGHQGWIGDNPFTFLDTRKINDAGWHPKLGIKESVIKTLEFLMHNSWAMEERKKQSC